MQILCRIAVAITIFDALLGFVHRIGPPCRSIIRHYAFQTPIDLSTEQRTMQNILLYRDSLRLSGSKIGTSKLSSRGNVLSPNRIKLEYLCCKSRSRIELI